MGKSDVLLVAGVDGGLLNIANFNPKRSLHFSNGPFRFCSAAQLPEFGHAPCVALNKTWPVDLLSSLYEQCPSEDPPNLSKNLPARSESSHLSDHDSVGALRQTP